MTTKIWAAVVDHSGNAGFRAWGLELSTNLAVVGLVKTSDTGQIDWATVNRPGTSTAGGYEVWRFADSSIYFKIEFGTGTSALFPQMWITVGTGSNGSGTITGQTSTRSTFTSNVAPASTTVLYKSFLCASANAFSLAWKVDAFSSVYPLGVVSVGKTVDNAGAATSTGFGVLRATASTFSFQSVRTAATAVTYTDSTLGWITFPGNPTKSTRNDGALQAYAIWANVPEVVPWPWAVGYVGLDVPPINYFAAQMVGSVSHNYLALGTFGALGNQGATFAIAVIFE